MTLLGDDDAPVPQFLEVALCELESGDVETVAWGSGQYVHPTWFVESERNQVTLSGYGGGVHEIASRTALQSLCRFESTPAPMMLNSLTSASVLTRIRKKFGRLFPPMAPDFAFSMASLAVCDTFKFIDKPLVLFGAASESIGVSSLYGDPVAIARFAEEFGIPVDELFRGLPLKLLTGKNVIAQTILAQLNRADFFGLALDQEAYLRASLDELLIWRANGRRTRLQVREWRAVAKRQVRGRQLARYGRQRLLRTSIRDGLRRVGADRIIDKMRESSRQQSQELCLKFKASSLPAAAIAVGTLIDVTRWPGNQSSEPLMGRW